MMNIPRILIAAPGSNSGKTYCTCGLLAALYQRQCKVSAFKCGPDYIDPMFHRTVLQTPSKNLDPFFTDEKITTMLFEESLGESEIAVIEGVMGYYDGLGGVSLDGSTYALANMLKTPVVLVVNVKGMSRSMVPYIKGFVEYQKDSRIKGVILNKVSSMLYPAMKTQIQEELRIEVLGYLPEQTEFKLPSRHLGLVLPEEIGQLRERFMKVGEAFEKTLEIERIMELAKAAEPLEVIPPEQFHKKAAKVTIAVAKDEAFCFYYDDNLNYLKKMGAELVFFSPLHDVKIPEADGILLGGGYPELYAQQLSENKEMTAQLQNLAKTEIPMRAECGGFMYLQQSLQDMNGRQYQMAGILPGESFYTGKVSRFGYITLFDEKGRNIKAHEFHYYDSTENGICFHAVKPVGNRAWDCIVTQQNIVAGFPHLYYPSAPHFAEEFVEQCRVYNRSKHKCISKENQ